MKNNLAKTILKFHKIELKNFRPYLDDFIEFSQDETKRQLGC